MDYVEGIDKSPIKKVPVFFVAGGRGSELVQA
ncbi:hypothetical protein CCACVL1_26482 [Corchorus capsularis]|uniref:Uncharacterized protein n=1 Tax=Corchorus capsularis TaxID=210143 RepID=A0A1R3GEP1_COCAP|nr:hypothetical protein CCACVL1_26482 [Corchorus capsularis]